ncbi:Glycine cleavage system transcriptional activator [plant metagenome]|uniref:Glycine cleavage system transcriptional activator n=2 Tax=root TaxID=1 RepID=A0A1C3JXF1_9BURK|nr:LysR substrate-binding domain-containing protein [Orrella dioscoreae]SBT23941.1 Glycine cleavage system transcriptional activator [Orrella dioscoreae]SOE47265.1 Glycine cleavage system transcriptional activator [Orrella dioscoreae]
MTRSPRLPPLNALRAFWVVMRHGSFRGAAEELLISPQAVSQQIQLLEESLKITLFRRRGRLIEPTDQAALLAPFVQAGFDELTEGVQRVTRASSRKRININVSPYFAMHYLMARLERFSKQMPDADLRLTTMVTLPDFTADEVDVSIQWGFGEWKDLDTTLLVRDPKIICCTPALARTIHAPEDLLTHTLLHPVMARGLWNTVLQHLGMDVTLQTGSLQLLDAATLRRAAIAGMGVGLVSDLHAHADLAAGRLVAPLGVDALDGMDPAQMPGFYLVLPRSHKRVATIEAFSRWVKAERWDQEPVCDFDTDCV